MAIRARLARIPGFHALAPPPSDPLHIPGVDMVSLVPVLALMVLLSLAIGPRMAPVLLLGFLFRRRLIMFRTRLLGPPVTNQGLIDERNRGFVVLVGIVFGSVVTWMAATAVLPDQKQVAAAIVFLAAMAMLVWFRPSMAVMPLLWMTAIGGSGMLLVAVPLVIMLARRDQRCRLRIARSLGRTAMTLLYAFVGLLTVLLFANASGGAPGTNGASEPQTPTSPTGEDSWFDRFSDWLSRRGPDAETSTPSRPVQVPRQEQSAPSTESTPWLLWLALAIGAAALIAFAIWFRRRRRGAADLDVSDPNAALTLARLESIGAAVGRRRAANEGALTFASALAKRTGDSRLDTAGPLVSGSVYGSTTAEPLVSSQLAAVEANPPAPPPTPPVTERVLGRVRSLPVSRRGVLVSAITLAGVGALGWWAVPLLGDLRDPVDRELAYVEQADAPEEWHTLMGAPTSDLVAWQSCSSGYESDVLGLVTAGVSHRTKLLGAEVYAYAGPDGLTPGELSVGTDEMSAYVDVAGSTAGISLGDESWLSSEWESVPLQPFPSVDAVLAAMAVRDPLRTDFVDRNGDQFARFESLPLNQEDLYAEDRAISPIVVDDAQLMHVIDVWIDDEGLPMRVRLIADGPTGQWTEWRRLPEVSDARLVLPSCALERPWANGDWIGSELWTPSRSTPLQIAVDDSGNPYDSFSWNSPDVSDEPSGTIEGPIMVLSIGDLNSISAVVDGDTDTGNGYGADYGVNVLWDAGAEVTLISADDWPVATRISAASASVVAWDEFESFVMYESFITVVTSPTFPELAPDELDPLLEPLWDGELQTTASVDGEPGDELTLLTQSEANEIVVGRDADGDVVSILVWAGWMIEWRELGFEGIPPPSVMDREAQLRECLAGDREVELTGRCSWDG